MKNTIRYILLLALLFCACYGEVSGSAVKSKPNIVVVLTDDLGYGDVSFLNSDSKVKTPCMDSLAKEGVYLTDAHSPTSVCSPTRYSLLTGRYAWRNPMLKRGVLMPWDRPAIGADEVTMPKLLKNGGYDTACIGKWHLGFTWPWKDGYSVESGKNGGFSKTTCDMFDWSRSITGGPLGAGFDYYFGDDVPNFPPYAFIENDHLTCDPVDIDQRKLESIGFRGGIHGKGPGQKGWIFERVMPEITKRAVAYIDKASKKDKPFFLYFATTSPHTPVVPTKEFQGVSEAGYYGDYVAQTDYSVGQIVKALKRNECFDDTLLIVTSDNGPSPAVQSVIKEYGHYPAAKLRGMKFDYWEGGHRVPFIASWPNKGISGGRRIDDQLVLTDVYATAAAAADVELTDPKDSLNLMKTLLGKGVVRKEMVYHNVKGNLGLRQGGWVLLEGSGGKKEPVWRKELFGIKSPDAPIQLFNLSDDLGQRVNVADKHPEIVSRLSARLHEIKQNEVKKELTDLIGANKDSKVKNVLFLISDDLKASVLSCYGDKVCKTPNIDKLANNGMVFNRAYCQGTWCAPSRVSFMNSRYKGSSNGQTLGEHMIENDIYSARVGKVFLMRVPGDIIAGTNGDDVAACWADRFNSKGMEAHTPGDYACLNKNIFTRVMEGRETTRMKNRMFVSVVADSDGSDQPDLKTADKVIELINKSKGKPFFIASGMVRPHYPHVSPKRFFDMYPWEKITPPKLIENDHADMPPKAITHSTSKNSGIGKYPDNIKRMWAAYYANVSFVDEQIGKILDELKRLGLDKSTAIVFFSDHGYHLGEHEFWQKVSLHEEVIRVPLIISVPGLKPGRTDSIAELVDIYPTVCQLMGIDVPAHVQGKSLVPVLKDHNAKVKDAALSFIRGGTSLRKDGWAYNYYNDKTAELYDMKNDSEQFYNLADNPQYKNIRNAIHKQLETTLKKASR